MHMYTCTHIAAQVAHAEHMHTNKHADTCSQETNRLTLQKQRKRKTETEKERQTLRQIDRQTNKQT